MKAGQPECAVYILHTQAGLPVSSTFGVYILLMNRTASNACSIYTTGIRRRAVHQQYIYSERRRDRQASLSVQYIYCTLRLACLHSRTLLG